MIKDIQVRYKSGSQANKSVFGEPIKLLFRTGDVGAKRWHMVIRLENEAIVHIALDDIIGMGKTRLYLGQEVEYTQITGKIASDMMEKRVNNGFSRSRLSLATGVTEAIIQKIECEDQETTAKVNIDTIFDFLKETELKKLTEGKK